MNARMSFRSALRASAMLTEADLADQADTLGVNHPLIPRRDAADARPAPAEFSPAGSGAGECEVDWAAMRHVEGRGCC